MDVGLTDNAVIVTGGASNIGKAITGVFAEEGARVAVFDRDEAMAGRTVGELADRGLEAVAYAVDLTDVEATKEAADAVERDLGPVEVLVNNVAWNGKASFFEQPCATTDGFSCTERRAGGGGIQLGLAAGARVIATAGSSEKREHCVGLGASCARLSRR